MLDEMKKLLCDAAARSKDQDLMERMESAYVFRVTFENGTAPLGSLLAEKNPEFDVSYRMLYQLAKDRKDWPAFVFELKQSYTKLPLYIEMVIDILAELKKVDNVKDMTVILCVDGLQKLVDDGTKKCDFYRVLTTICRFLNSSRAFAVCVCSATVQTPVDQALSYSHQKRVYLLPPALRGWDVLKPRTRLEEQLVDDMGGHGRALETLDSVLRQYTKDRLEQTDPADIVEQTLSIARSCSLQFSLAVVYGVFECVAPDMTVDRLRSFGMIRWNPDRTLECAFILLQMLLRALPKTAGDLNNFNEHFTRTMWGLQQFEQFVAFYRRVKSMGCIDGIGLAWKIWQRCCHSGQHRRHPAGARVILGVCVHEVVDISANVQAEMAENEVNVEAEMAENETGAVGEHVRLTEQQQELHSEDGQVASHSEQKHQSSIFLVELTSTCQQVMSPIGSDDTAQRPSPVHDTDVQGLNVAADPFELFEGTRSDSVASEPHARGSRGSSESSERLDRL
ncbi:hypothetical protein PF011_g28502, partial [Phytophthora fragariae]